MTSDKLKQGIIRVLDKYLDMLEELTDNMEAELPE